MKNIQDWEKKFDKRFGKQKLQLEYVGTIGGVKICSEEFKQTEVVDIAEAKKFIKKQITKARKEAVKGFVYYLFPVEMYHSSDVKDEFWWSREDALIEAEKYLKSSKDKK